MIENKSIYIGNQKVKRFPSISKYPFMQNLKEAWYIHASNNLVAWNDSDNDFYAHNYTSSDYSFPNGRVEKKHTYSNNSKYK